MEVPQRNTLSKSERLYCKKDIENLLARGRFATVDFLRCCILRENGCSCSRIMVSVPKKFFKRAVKRNLLKRRIRESFRLQKSNLSQPTDILFTYFSKEIRSYEEIYAVVGKIIARANGQDKS